VLGQVTRVYPLSAEVTLLADKDAAIPVLNPRTQQRSAAFGGVSGEVEGMELRFLAGNADVQPGDLLLTSGVDGVYPPGLSVARVVKVDRRVDSNFARIVLQPTARADGVRHVLVLDPLATQMQARPEAEAQAATKPARRSAKR
jgi:rod shape-determining protein MreC